jgi:hypothetical protein
MFRSALVTISLAGPGVRVSRLWISGCVTERPMRPSADTMTRSDGKTERIP